jgi:hypothetical protein
MATRDIINGTYGIDFVMGSSFDMSGNTSLLITFLKPDKTTLAVAATLGTVQKTTSEGIFAANEWAFYTFVNGDIDQVGDWAAVLDYFVAPTEAIPSTTANFTVVERGDVC